MKAILFGATGMIGQAVLRECLLDPDVTDVLCVGRRPTGQTHAKVRELSHQDFTDFTAIQGELAGYDACFFCLGVSSAGMNEADYRHVTYDFTLAAARALLAVSPAARFLYVSGASTDSTEKGSAMWARVKGATENALLAMPFGGGAYMARPGIIQPQHGIRSSTRVYRIGYIVMWPFFPLLKALFPARMLTSDQLGRAMVRVGKHGADKHWLEVPDLVAIGDADTAGRRTA